MSRWIREGEGCTCNEWIPIDTAVYSQQKNKLHLAM
jgi:hypothetical protein